MDKKSIFKDIFSPSNLWTAFQYGSPTAAAAVSGALSYLWHLPPSVTIGLAFVSAASTLIFVDALKKASPRGKVSVGSFTILHFLRSAGEPALSLIQPGAVVTNHSPDNAIYFDAEILSLVIQGKANAMAERVGGSIYLPPLGTRNLLLPMIKDVEDGMVEGRTHLRIMYGKSKSNLNVVDEYKFRLRGEIVPDDPQEPSIIFNVFLEEYRPG